MDFLQNTLMDGRIEMKYYPPNNKSIYIREVYEDTYESINDYILDTMIWKNRVDELHTIWIKGKDPKKDT